jgi:uncharacterized membrane protein YhaH (DUF805 family)
MWRQIPASHSVGVNFANPGQAIGRDAVTVRQTLDPGSPFEIYKSVLTQKYADFTGRARRAEYWWFVLVNLGVTIGISVVTLILASSNDSSAGLGAIIYIVYGLGVIVPSFAVAVRRLHDTNKSGWMLLILFIPLVGPILLLVFYFTDGDPGANQYGPSPKYVS